LGTIKIEMPNWSVGIRKTHVSVFGVKNLIFTAARVAVDQDGCLNLLMVLWVT
jgi:hypothetical protein